MHSNCLKVDLCSSGFGFLEPGPDVKCIRFGTGSQGSWGSGPGPKVPGAQDRVPRFLDPVRGLGSSRDVRCVSRVSVHAAVVACNRI